MDSISRGRFEQVVRSAFDPVVTAYGFSLTPQPPADHVEQGRAAAVYETTPADFTRRFPNWAAHWDFDDVGGCVDLWIEADLPTNRVDVHLEGEDIRELAEGWIGKADAHPRGKGLEDALEDAAALCAVALSSRAAE